MATPTRGKPHRQQAREPGEPAGRDTDRDRRRAIDHRVLEDHHAWQLRDDGVRRARVEQLHRHAYLVAI